MSSVPNALFLAAYPLIDKSALAAKIDTIFDALVLAHQRNFDRAVTAQGLVLGDYANPSSGFIDYQAQTMAGMADKAKLDAYYGALKTAVDAIMNLDPSFDLA